MDYLSIKQVNLIIDYHSNSLISNIKSKRKNFTFFDNFDKSNKKFYSYAPWALGLLNIFNFETIIRQKIFYSNENMKEIMSTLFKLNLRSLREDVLFIYRLAANTIGSILKINFHPITLLNQSALYTFGFLNFTKRQNKLQGLTNQDYLELFFISGIGMIPITNFLSNFHYKKYVCEEKIKLSQIPKLYLTPFNNKLGWVCAKSISDNFILLALFFSSINAISQIEKDVKTLHQKENYSLFKEMINNNERFKRVEKLSMKDEPIKKTFELSLPIIYSAFLVGILYTPIDFTINYMLNSNLTCKEVIKQISSNEFNRALLFSQFKNLIFMNVGILYMKYGLALNNYSEYLNSL